MLRLATIVLSLLCATLTARGDTFTFNLQSLHPGPVQVKFYSQSRNATWPGPGNGYTIRDSEVHPFRLNCRAGEKICFGAWDFQTGKLEWATGIKGDDACKNCCWQCSDRSETHYIRLFLAKVPQSNRRVPAFDVVATPPKKPRPSVSFDDSQ